MSFGWSSLDELPREHKAGTLYVDQLDYIFMLYLTARGYRLMRVNDAPLNPDKMQVATESMITWPLTLYTGAIRISN